jgi:hypothetical protein
MHSPPDRAAARQRSVPPQRWAVIGSHITLQTPSIRKPLHGVVREIDGTTLTVQTDLGLIRARSQDCHPSRPPNRL